VADIVGIISDTHGLIRDEALAALAGVSLIIHAGDVGVPEVLTALSAIAPVHAVRGNVDIAGPVGALPEALTVDAGGARIYVRHNLAELDFDPRSRGYHAIISGHSHRASHEIRQGVLYCNPGSAGPRRFHLPVTLARLTVDGSTLRPEIVTLLP
jgi:putative phosphoesterase